MTAQEAITGTQALVAELSPLLAVLTPLAPAQAGTALAAIGVVSAFTAMAAKLAADNSADVTEEAANLKRAHDDMVASVAAMDSIADSQDG